MNKIRIGNDINLEFTIFRNDVPETIGEAVNVDVKLVHEQSNKIEMRASRVDASRNPLRILVSGADQARPGVYRLVVKYRKPDPSQEPPFAHFAVDAVAFELVEQSSMQGVCPSESAPVDVETVRIEGCVLRNPDGITPGKGVTDHTALENLDYENSGHTGFAPASGLDELRQSVGHAGERIDALDLAIAANGQATDGIDGLVASQGQMLASQAQAIASQGQTLTSHGQIIAALDEAFGEQGQAVSSHGAAIAHLQTELLGSADIITDIENGL